MEVLRAFLVVCVLACSLRTSQAVDCPSETVGLKSERQPNGHHDQVLVIRGVRSFLVFYVY